jgi:hypothetical protein
MGLRVVLKRRYGCGAAFVLASGVAALLMPAVGRAAPTISTGTAEPLYTSSAPSVRDLWMQRTVDVGAQYVRINVPWFQIAPTKPLLPVNPEDSAYDWDAVDGAVTSADAAGLRVVFTVYGAPPWAHPSDVPSGVRPEAWKPSASDFGKFAQALATRYSVPSLTDPTPPVRWYEVWNEPNLKAYIAPQFKGKKPMSPTIYSRLLNAAYTSIKQVAPTAQVISAGTAPYGRAPGGEKMHPITFLQSLFCVQGVKPCAPKPRMDIIAAHPIDRKQPPTHSAPNKLDVVVPDLGRIRKVIRAAQTAHTAPKPLPLWVTEFWWETNPPDSNLGVPPMKQAQNIEYGLYSFWKQGVPVAINLQMRDAKTVAGNPLATYQTGVYYFDDKPKPSRTAFKFPFIVDTPKHSKGLAWGRSPGTGKVALQKQRKGGFKTVATATGTAGAVFTKKVLAKKGDVFRAFVSGETSLPWHVP